MSDVNVNPISEEQLKSFLDEFDQKINGYMLSLKKRSSEEILNGSAQKAQNLLNKIIRVEAGVEKVSIAHKDFFKLIKGDFKTSSPVEEPQVSFTKTATKQTEKNDDELVEHIVIKNKSDSRSFKYRMPLLKALIYLGGNAQEDDVLEFVHKEIKKNLTEEELSVNGDGKTKIWVRDLKVDSAQMVEEGLLTKDTEDNSYEITQMGIDYLAKNDD